MTLLFLHVPKTGGTTIHNDLRDALGRIYLRSTLNRGRGGHEFLTEADVRAHLAPMAKDMAAVSGHLFRFPVPIEGARVAHTTVLRDPFDWALSHYFHACRRQWIATRVSFESYLTEHYGLGNYQTLHFAACGRAANAVETLRQCVLVGVTDQLDAYREMLASFVANNLGATMEVGHRADNVAPNRNRGALQLTAREQRAVIDVLGEDIKLYHYARARFQQHLETREATPTQSTALADAWRGGRCAYVGSETVKILP